MLVMGEELSKNTVGNPTEQRVSDPLKPLRAAHLRNPPALPGIYLLQSRDGRNMEPWIGGRNATRPDQARALYLR